MHSGNPPVPNPFPKGNAGHAWFSEHLPRMSEEEFVGVLSELKRRGWTPEELEQRVYPIRRPRTMVLEIRVIEAVQEEQPPPMSGPSADLFAEVLLPAAGRMQVRRRLSTRGRRKLGNVNDLRPRYARPAWAANACRDSTSGRLRLKGQTSEGSV